MDSGLDGIFGGMQAIWDELERCNSDLEKLFGTAEDWLTVVPINFKQSQMQKNADLVNNFNTYGDGLDSNALSGKAGESNNSKKKKGSKNGNSGEGDNNDNDNGPHAFEESTSQAYYAKLIEDNKVMKNLLSRKLRGSAYALDTK